MAQEEQRNTRKYNDPNFKLKQANYSSYMQSGDALNGAQTERKGQYQNQRKGTTENQFWKRPTTVSQDARNRFYYTSNVTF